MIYLGTANNKYIYLSFKEAGNVFIHGCVGSGKTYYIESIYKRLKKQTDSSSTHFAFWSFKPFEFEKWCGEYLYKDQHDFITNINKFSNDKTNQTVVFIDELYEFIWNITNEEKETLKTLMKLDNMTFICNSQNMHMLIDEFSEYAKTRVCMKCFSEKESILMIDSSIDSTIQKHGIMYAKNDCLEDFITNKAMRIIKPDERVQIL